MEKSVTLNANGATEALFELLKQKPWLNQPGIMTAKDASAEPEAVAFLLKLCRDDMVGWGTCSDSARRVVCSLLIDFVAKLQQPSSSMRTLTWSVPAHLPAWRQALAVIEYEIARSHPQQTKPH